MDDHKIIAAYCIIDEVLHELGHKSHYHARLSDAEVLTVAVVAAMYYHNNHVLALDNMQRAHFIKPLSASRFSRRLHALADLLEFVVEVVGELFAGEQVFIIDSMPAPVCKYVRAYRCRKIPAAAAAGRHYFGHCKAKKERFYGWRLHLITTAAGVPVRFMLLPAAWHDLTPIYELTYGLAKGAKVYGDKGYISALVKRQLRPTYSREQRDGVWLIAKHKKNMQANSYEERLGLEEYRHSIETRNSQLENMGVERLHARTNAGFALKILASLLALACINLY